MTNTKNYLLPIAMASLLTIGGFATGAIAEEAVSLGVPGCYPVPGSITATNDNRVLFAGCEGPKGLYYSKDQGLSWTFAEGGIYTAGSGRTVHPIGDYGYANDDANNGVMRLQLPTSGNINSWTPTWESYLQSYATLGSIANRWLLLSTRGPSAIPGHPELPQASYILTYDTQTSQVSAWAYLPTVSAGESLSFITVNDNYIYYAKNLTGGGSPDASAVLYRAAVDSVTGDIGISGPEDWSSFAVSSAIEDASLENAQKVEKIAPAPDGKIYIAVRATSGCNQPIYQAGMFGGTVSSVVQNNESGDPVQWCTPLRTFSFSGSNHLLENQLSRDGGTTFTPLSAPPDVGSITVSQLDPTSILLDPNSADYALLRTNIGIKKIANLNQSQSSWTYTETAGLESIEVFDLVQHPTNKDLVAINTKAGYAITNSFTSNSPSWTTPICIGANCFGGRALALDPAAGDDFKIFMGSGQAIARVTITYSGGSPSKTEEILTTQAQQINFGQFYTSPHFPETLIVTNTESQGTVNGGIHFYNTTTGAEIGSTRLNGIPINRIISLNSSILYAAVGADNDNSPLATNRGMYISSDGGNTWNRVTDSHFSSPEVTLVTDFAYDTTNDILYVSTKDGSTANWGVLRLNNASTCGASCTWQETANASGASSPFLDNQGNALNGSLHMRTIAVDSTTGQVALAGGGYGHNYIWTSDDQGVSWTYRYAGRQDESINVVSFDSASSSAFRALTGIGTRTASRLVQGSSTGLYSLSQSLVLPTPTPTATPTATPKSPYSCSLSLNKSCQKTVKKGARCTLTASIKENKKAMRNASFKFEKSSKAAGPFSAVSKTRKTNSKGTYSINIKAPSASTYYRSKFSNPACTSSSVRLKVKK